MLYIDRKNFSVTLFNKLGEKIAEYKDRSPKTMYCKENISVSNKEIALQNKSSTALSTVSEFTYNNLAYDSTLGNLVNNWHLAIGAYRTWMTATVTRSGDSYTMTIQYNLRDIYDWNPNNTNMGLIVSQSQMHTLYEAGMAREYKVVGNTSVRVTWNSGQTLGNGASWMYV